MVLVYGLVVAPVVHALVDHAGQPWQLAAGLMGARDQAHGHSHWHEGAGAAQSGPAHAEQGPAEGHEDKEPGHRHGVGSVEHLGAVAVAHAVVLAPVVRWVRLVEAEFHGPLRRPGEPVRLTAMPQGP